MLLEFHRNCSLYTRAVALLDTDPMCFPPHFLIYLPLILLISSCPLSPLEVFPFSFWHLIIFQSQIFFPVCVQVFVYVEFSCYVVRLCHYYCVFEDGICLKCREVEGKSGRVFWLSVWVGCWIHRPHQVWPSLLCVCMCLVSLSWSRFGEIWSVWPIVHSLITEQLQFYMITLPKYWENSIIWIFWLVILSEHFILMLLICSFAMIILHICQ